MKTFHRILIKISGEVFAGNEKSGLDHQSIQSIAAEITEVYHTDKEIGIVIGAGNILRGSSTNFLTRVKSDSAGMLGTAINSIALQDILQKEFHIPAVVLGAFGVEGMFPKSTPETIIQSFQKKEIIIFAGGIGCPYFSTDTAGVLKALEIGADIMIKSTKVDGIYNKDPLKNPDAVKFDHISYEQVLSQKLNVMDLTAISLAMENKLPLAVIDITEKTLNRFLHDQSIGTLVS
ncbi:MAG: UMP kinase [Brevinemataceae bacterium]